MKSTLLFKLINISVVPLGAAAIYMQLTARAPGSILPAMELDAVEPVEELAELTMLALLLLAPLTPPVLALLWLLLFQPSLVLLARCLGLCSLM